MENFYNLMYTSLLKEAEKNSGKIASTKTIASLGAMQSAIETGRGESLAGGHNYFGIKAKPGAPFGTFNIKDTLENVNGKMINVKAGFRKYNNMDESAADYILFLKENSRYADVLKATTIEDAILAQSVTGYASDINYGTKLAQFNYTRTKTKDAKNLYDGYGGDAVWNAVLASARAGYKNDDLNAVIYDEMEKAAKLYPQGGAARILRKYGRQTKQAGTSVEVDTNYINQVYKIPYGKGRTDNDKTLALNSLNNYLNDVKLRVETTEALARDSKNLLRASEAVLTNDNIKGELSILAELQGNVASDNSIITSESQLNAALTPMARYDILTLYLFEFYRDDMRNNMAKNAYTSSDVSHAWRAPSKLAITADLTIPGMSGFRIGQVFFVGRTYNYKKNGVFQLFGITENITVDSGWTTLLHSRFNVLPQKIISKINPL